MEITTSRFSLEQSSSLYTTPLAASCSRINLFASIAAATCKSPRLLQTEIDGWGWQEKLRADPPLPPRSYPIDRTRAKQWIDAHPTKEDREMANAFIAATKHVSHAEFEDALRHSVSQFNQFLKKQSSKEYLLVVSEEGKSNRWVSELALKYLDVLPVEVLKLDSRSNEFQVGEPIIEYVKNHPKLKHIVVIDDAAYSCMQAKGIVGKLGFIDLQAKCGIWNTECLVETHQKLLKAKSTRQISVIIPYMNDPKCVFMKSDVPLNGAHPNIDSSLHVFTAQKITRLRELMTPKHYQTFQKLMNRGKTELLAEMPIYFDHKIPDEVSSFPEIYERGAIAGQAASALPFIDKITPPYKTVKDQLSTIDQDLQSFLAFFPQGQHSPLAGDL